MKLKKCYEKDSRTSYNRRGQLALDLIIVIGVLFVFAIVAFVSVFVSNSINDELQADDDFSAEAKAASQEVNTGLPTWLDNAYLFILIGFWIILLVSSFLIDAHPVFFIITVILMIIILVAGMVLWNGLDEILAEPEFEDLADSFPKLAWVNSHWLIIMIIISFTTLLALYAKGQYV